jgi:hypothetical protein
MDRYRPFNADTGFRTPGCGAPEPYFRRALISYTNMPRNSLKRMSDNDLKAVYNFLKTLPPSTTSSSK